jgi:2-phospho-L-lactate guanylyltransferase
MRYILIPVKDLSQAKLRLAGLMTPEERKQLAWAMLERTFTEAARVQSVARVAVVSSYEPALEVAERYGMQMVIESEQTSESASIDFGSRRLEQLGAGAVLRLPIDLPLITAEDIEEVLALDVPAPSTVIVPSRDGVGTNAILRRPPTLFQSHFGPDSLEKHLAEARLVNAQCEIIHLDGIGLDIDEPADIAELMKRKELTTIHDVLKDMGIAQRLRDFGF